VTTSSELLTVPEVAARLRCSQAHVCNLINGKVKGVTPVPAIRLGRRKLVRGSALRAWLAQNERAAVERAAML
jgi:excisionase family DNA binding protein